MMIKTIVGVMVFFLSSLVYCKPFYIPKHYRGGAFVQSKELFLQLEKKCSSLNNEREYRPSERKNCPLDKLNFDFSAVYKNAESKVTIIDRVDYLVTLEKRNINYSFNNDQYVGQELLLSLVYKGEVRDTLVLATSYANETSFASVSDSYYYLSTLGDIYTLQVITTDDGASPLLWKHYRIDEKNHQFSLKEMFINRALIRYEITYPSVFSVLSATPTIYKPEQFEDCSNTKYYDHHCSLDTYVHYSDLLKRRNLKSAYLEIEKRINSICLKNKSPSRFSEIDNFINSLMSCLIEQTKKNLNHIDH